MEKVEEDNFTSKHRQSCNWLIKSLLKGKNKSEKLQKWYEHFFNLLVKKLQINRDVESKIIDPPFTDLVSVINLSRL